MVVSSGDGGATNYDRDSKVEGSPAYGTASCEAYPNFSAQYPASSPYVTAVGATAVASDGEEQVCSTVAGAMITSGGGFSSYSPRPSYQAAAVDAWASSALASEIPRFLLLVFFNIMFWPIGFPNEMAVECLIRNSEVTLMSRWSGITSTSASKCLRSASSAIQRVWTVQ